MPGREQAIVKPPSGGKMIFKQSRFEHLATVPFRTIAAGRSGSGKTSALYSAVTDHYRGCFKHIIIVNARDLVTQSPWRKGFRV